MCVCIGAPGALLLKVGVFKLTKEARRGISFADGCVEFPYMESDGTRRATRCVKFLYTESDGTQRLPGHRRHGL